MVTWQTTAFSVQIQGRMLLWLVGSMQLSRAAILAPKSCFNQKWVIHHLFGGNSTQDLSSAFAIEGYWKKNNCIPEKLTFGSPKPKWHPECNLAKRSTCSHPPKPFWPHLLLLLVLPSWAGGSVAIVVWFEGPLGGQTQVLGLLVGQLGQLHSQFVQVGCCHLLIQLLRQRESSR